MRRIVQSSGTFMEGKRQRAIIACCLLFLCTVATVLPRHAGAAETVRLVRDIAAGTGSSDPAYLTSLDGAIYFAAFGGTNGNGLWKSDGTEAGTVLVKSLINPANVTNVNGTLYLRAYLAGYGIELWKSDGTETGTVMVTDLFPGTTGSSPEWFTAVNGMLFFTADGGSNGKGLWKTDGTAAGTVLLKANSTATNTAPKYLTNVGGALFFVYEGCGTGSGIWKSDGTEAGTTLVKGFSCAYPSELTDVNGTLFFTVNDGTHGAELWKSDGTEAGTVLVKDINPGTGYSSPQYLKYCNGTLFFKAYDQVHGQELWKSDGTDAGTVLVKDINAGVADSLPNGFAAVSNTLYLRANDGINGMELWKSDGTDAGTLLVKDLTPGSNGGFLKNLTDVDGTLYLSSSDQIVGQELWKSDGSTAGTVLVKDINAGALHSYPEKLTSVNGILFFSANDGINGIELWAVNPNAAPLASIITSPADGAYLNDASITISGKGINETGTGVEMVELSTDNGATWHIASGTSFWSYPWFPAEGYYTIMARAIDALGNVEIPGPEVSVVIDRTPPVGSILINGSAATTDRTAVTLTLNADSSPPGIYHCPAVIPYICGTLTMQFSNDLLTWSAWETATTAKSWQVSTGDGEKIVYARFRDLAGNVSPVYEDRIVLDTSLMPKSVIQTPPANNYTNSPSVLISGTATPGTGRTVQIVEVSVDGGTTWFPASGTASWSYGWMPASGRYTILSRATDNTGSRETPGAGITVTVDRILPTGTLSIGSGQLTINASATIPGMACIQVYPFICGNPEMQLSPDGVTWGAWQLAVTTVPWPHYTAHARLRDGAGNLTVISTSITPPPIRFGTTLTPYYSLQEACDDAQAETTIQLRAESFSGNILLGRNVSIVMRGGYREDFSARIGYSIIVGVVAVNGGDAALEGLEIHGSLDIGNGSVIADDVLIL